MAELVFVLCATMSLLCTFLLFRGYLRTQSRFLLWSALCFVFLAATNVNLVIDMVVFPNVDTGGPYWRSLLGAISGSLLLFGLVWEII